MKALISAISLAVVLVGAATAQAVSGSYHGNNAEGGLVVFGTQLRHGHNHTVRPFLTGNVVLHCPSGGELRRSYNTNQTMRVSKKERFSGLLSPVTDPDQEVDPTIVTTIQVTGVF